MKVEEKEFLEFLNKQVDLENRIVKRVEESTKETRNKLIKELLMGIGYDSLKHANMLRGLMAILEAKTPFLTEEESREFLDGIREHIELEAKAIETYSSILEKTDDERIKLIISYILEDEKRHHALLKTIEKAIIEKQTLSEEDLFNLVWQYSISHGTPGG